MAPEAIGGASCTLGAGASRGGASRRRIEVPPDAPAATIERHDCSITLRRVDGPQAREIFLLARPPAAAAAAADQAEAIYRAILDVLADEGASFDAVVCETVFLRRVAGDTAAVRAARTRVLREEAVAEHRPATLEIEQPPLAAGEQLEVAVQAVAPRAGALDAEWFELDARCGCDECARARGLRLRLGGELRFHAAGLCGAGADAYEQSLAMFEAAEALLRRAGMDFGDVVRTWIHLRAMERDYAALNRARRAFFERRGIDPAPASTGIGGAPVGATHDLCLGLQAVRRADGVAMERSLMHTPTLNEAPEYGSDFARGMRVEESNKVALHVSGTASLDEAGRTVHVGDLDAQVERTLTNVAALLEGQGAGFGDVVSAITYLKRPEDADRLRARLDRAGFAGFPNALVAAEVCRPELLCEIEVLAALPRGPLGE